jgi:pSer/pThr/pTyr-binding forkhead associated (FHA) protein
VVIVDGPSAGQSAALDDLPLLVGRGPDAAIRLDDDYVSTRHARIGSSNGTFYVEDLGSTNGTYIGSQRLTSATAVQLGTQVRVGKTTLELKK